MKQARRSGPRARAMKREVVPGSLKKVRVERLNWLQTELAEKAGVGVATVGRAEAGVAIRAMQAQWIEDVIRRALKEPIPLLFADARTSEVCVVLSEERVMPPPSIMPPTSQNDANGVWMPQPTPGSVWFDPNTKRLWRMRRSKYLPIDARDLRTGMGRVSRFETPQEIVTAAEARPDVLLESDVHGFLREMWTLRPELTESFISGCPSLKCWVDNIWAPVPPGSKDLEQEQLKKFFLLMDGYRRTGTIIKKYLPQFSYKDISCWRIYVQAFPESIALLEAISADKEIAAPQRMAASLLCSALATTDDSTISSRACAISARLRDEVSVSTVYNYNEYQVVRQFLFGAVEAEEFPVGRMLNFLHDHSKTNWEFLLNRGYYDDPTDKSFAFSIVKKCTRPLPRDKRTERISEYHRNQVLPRDLVDETDRIIAAGQYGPAVKLLRHDVTNARRLYHMTSLGRV